MVADDPSKQTASGPEPADHPDATAPARTLPPAARRALAEAAERRRKAEAEAAAAPTEREVGGRGGADPARFGDWEVSGRAIDF